MKVLIQGFDNHHLKASQGQHLKEGVLAFDSDLGTLSHEQVGGHHEPPMFGEDSLGNEGSGDVHESNMRVHVSHTSSTTFAK